MTKKSQLSDEDKALFRSAVRHVTPLGKQKKVSASPFPKLPKIKIRKEDDEEKAILPFTDEEFLPFVTGSDLIQFSRPGIHHKTLRKLHRGQYNVEAILDLHGMKVTEAKEAVSDFLQRCQRKGARFVLIIHGKGQHSDKPILKNKINHWLRQTDQVLAFCSAASHRSRGGGAVCVLLKQGEKQT